MTFVGRVLLRCFLNIPAIKERGEQRCMQEFADERRWGRANGIEKKAKGVGVRKVCYYAGNRLMGVRTVKTMEVARST